MNLLDELPKEILTLEEQYLLLKRGRESDLNKIVLHSMREAFLYAAECCRRELEDAEIFSLCYQALQQAADNYCRKKSKGVTFFGFAKVFIRGQISRAWKSRDVVRNAKHENGDWLLYTPFIERNIPHVQADFDSYHENKTLTTKPHSKPVFDQIQEFNFEPLILKEKWSMLKKLIIKKLNMREQMVLTLHYHTGWSFEEIAKKLEVSRQAIQHTHSQALHKLRSDKSLNKALLNV